MEKFCRALNETKNFFRFNIFGRNDFTVTFINELFCHLVMGRIKTTFIKRKTKELLKLHGEQFSTDFSSNKEVTDRTVIVPCKRLRNVIAGYMTRLKKKEM